MTISEKELYGNVINTMKGVFDLNYLENPKTMIDGRQNIPPEWVTNPNLEDTHDTHAKLSEEIKSHFDIIMFGKLYGSDIRPDIMGYVIKKEGTKPELIIVEVKKDDIALLDVMQARLYELFFKSKFTFLLSPMGITREKMEAIMLHDNLLRGNVIIGSCGDEGKNFTIDPKLKDKLPKELKKFQKFCRLAPDMQQWKKLWSSP
ncbi:MAG: hypothetical protein NWF01_07945 [Candidatus Bathyarchaeota archaeon]|nr:hypothetical protein [Candidatus Bathyarchaeota archaeon]